MSPQNQDSDELAKGNDPNNPVRIYCDGVFDMFHIGHAKVLEQAKKMYKHVELVAGVSGDEETIRLKGRTVMNEKERAESVFH
jgi:cytidyltransferase-like protein